MKKLAILLVLVTILASRAFAQTNVGTCTTLSTPGESYALNATLFNTGTCITITAANVTLDCAGFKINGSYTGDGIFVSSSSNVTVTNCFVQNFANAIRALDSQKTNLTNNTANSGTNGIVILGSSNYSTITQSYAQNNTGEGFSLTGGSFLQAWGITASSNGGTGIHLTAPKAVISGSVANNNSAEGLLLDDFNATIQHTDIYQNLYGLHTNGSGSHGLNNVTTRQNTQYGMLIEDRYVIISSSFSNNNQDGFRTNTNWTYFNSITALGNTRYGVALYQHGHILQSATLTNNTQGISITGTNQTLSGLTITNSSIAMNFTNASAKTTGDTIKNATIVGVLVYASNANFSSESFQNLNEGMRATSQSQIIIDASSFSNATTETNASSNSSIKFLSVTFNRSRQNFFDNSNLTVQWGTDVKTQAQNGTPIANTVITIKDNRTTTAFSGQTASNGQIPKQFLTEYLQNASATWNTNYNNSAVIMYTSHQLFVGAEGYYSNPDLFYFINDTTFITLTLNASNQTFGSGGSTPTPTPTPTTTATPTPTPTPQPTASVTQQPRITAPQTVTQGQTIEIVIRDQNGNPMYNVQVVVQFPSGRQFTTKSKIDGRITFIAEEAGTYKITIQGLMGEPLLIESVATNYNQTDQGGVVSPINLTQAQLQQQEAELAACPVFKSKTAGVCTGYILSAIAVLAGLAVIAFYMRKKELETVAIIPPAHTGQEWKRA
ncbi:MAG TPA: right-handed parallel beta-helix repeat-containing protein [Candidatus Norongarragalinales archaeon]|jgi:parallel beta-helix repeat protein|nr:right-handed parallel beta-helix repeat-containing protein [Candidatus Norongarragalinales archaeon]